MKTRRITAFILIALLMAALFLVSCTQKQPPQGNNVTSAPEPTAELTFEPTELPQTENPTDEPTAAQTAEPHPSIPCAPASELNAHDFNAVRSFLEITDETGVRNGEKMNEFYDPEDPSTWFFWDCISHEDDGNIPLAVFNEAGRLTSFFIPGIIRLERGMEDYMEMHYDFVGNLDLSNCEELISVEITYSTITSLDVTGCDEPHLDIKFTTIEEILPDPIKAFHASIYGNKTKRLHWVTVPEEHEEFCTNGVPWFMNNFSFDLTVVSQGDGFVGINNDFGGDGSTSHSGVELRPFWDFENESISFVGWYDENGNLISTERGIELPADNETGLVEGTFYYEARFETLSGH